MEENKSSKVLFRLFSNILDEITVETMWTQIVDKEKGLYKLDNIPFYLQSLACDDIIFAEFDEDEGMLTYREVVEYSGNSTIHVVILDDTADIDQIRKIFEVAGCNSEKLHDKYFAMNIPANVDYKPTKLELQKLEESELISFAESSLSEQHWE